MCLNTRVAGATHDGPQEHGLEVPIVIRQMRMGLPEIGNDLRHLEPERPISGGHDAAVVAGLTLSTTRCRRPDLDSNIGKRLTATCFSHSAGDQKTGA